MLVMGKKPDTKEYILYASNYTKLMKRPNLPTVIVIRRVSLEMMMGTD